MDKKLTLYEIVNHVIDTVKKGNPDNFFINNKGLSELGAVLFYPKDNQKLMSDKIHQLLRENYPPDELYDILDSLKKYHFTSYYTPKELIDFQIGLLKENKIEPSTILEPSAGNGAYVEQLKKIYPNAKIVALEPDILSYQVLRANNLHSKNVEVINTTFEDYYLQNQDKKFDLVISNIPFAEFSIKAPYKHKYANEIEKKVNIYFNRYMPEMVNNGGYSFILTSKNFLDRGRYETVRENIIKENDFIDTFRFNNKLFKDEKTKVVTDLIIYRKNKDKPQQLSNKEKLYLNTNYIEIEGKSFPINNYIKDNPEKVNGEYNIGVFHSREDITVVEKENDTLISFLKRQLQLSQNVLDSSNSRQQEKSSIIKPKGEEKTEDIVEKKKTEIASKKEDFFSLKSSKDFLIKNTSLFKGSYNLDDRGVIQYFNSPTNSFTVKNTKKALLLNTYIALRNEFVFLELNSLNGVADIEHIKQKFSDISYMSELFNFQYGFLREQKELLNKDFYFEKIHQALEKNINGKLSVNPDFSVEYFTKLLPQGKSIKTEPELLVKNQVEDTISPKDEQKVLPENNLSLQELVYNFYDENGYIDLDILTKKSGISQEELLKKGFEQKLFYYNPVRNSNNEFEKFDVDLFFRVESGNIDRKIQDFQKFKYLLPSQLDINNIVNHLESIKNEKLDIEKISFNFESFFVPSTAKKEFFKDLINEDVDIVEEQFSSSTTLYFNREFNNIANEKFSVRDENDNVIYSYKKLLQNFVDNKFPILTKTFEGNDGKKVKVLDKRGTIIAQNLYEQVHLEFRSFIENNAMYKSMVENSYYHYFLADKNIKTTDKILKFPNTIPFEPYKHQKEAVMFSLLNSTALLDHEVGHGKTLTMGMLSYKLLQQNKAQKVLISTMKAIAPQFEKETKANFPMLKVFRLDEKNFNKKNRNKTLEKIKKGDYNVVICEHSHLPNIPKEDKYVERIYESKLDMIEQDLKVAENYGTKINKQIVKGLVKRKDSLQEKLDALLEKNLTKNSETDRANTFSKLGFDALMIDECHEFKNIGYTTRHDGVSGLNSNVDRTKNLDLEIAIASIHDRVGKDKNVFFFSGTPIKNSVTELYAYQRYLQPGMLKEKNIYNFDAWASIFLKQSIKLESDILGNPKINRRFRYFTNMPELSKMYHNMAHISNSQTFKTHNLSVKQDFVTLDCTDKLDELKEASAKFVRMGKQDELLQIPKYTDTQMKGAHVIALGINRRVLVDPLIEKDNINIKFDENDQVKVHRVCEDVYDLYNKTSPHKGVSLIFSDIGVWDKQKDYNTYDTIKNILIDEYNIPKEEIGIAQEYKIKNKTQEFQEKIRNGEIRIAIGSTSSLGTGLNIQKRGMGVFNLDIPYSPDAYIQRLGRVLRAGNEVAQFYDNQIIEKSYGIKNTTDIFSYSLNNHKEKFKNQLKDINNNERVYDDVITDEKELSYSQREAALVGDMDAFKLSSLEDDLKALETQKQLFEITKNNATKKIARFESINNSIGKEIIRYNHLNDKVVGVLVPDISKIERNENYDKNVEKLTYEQYKKILSKEEIEKFGEHNNFKDFSKLIHKNITNFQGYETQKQIFQIVNKDFGLYFSLKRTCDDNDKYVYNYLVNVSLSTEKNGIQRYNLQSKNLRGVNDKNIPYQLFKILNEVPSKIKELNFSFDYNKKTIESNKANLNRNFPSDKDNKITEIKQEIKQIKRGRKM